MEETRYALCQSTPLASFSRSSGSCSITYAGRASAAEGGSDSCISSRERIRSTRMGIWSTVVSCRNLRTRRMAFLRKELNW